MLGGITVVLYGMIGLLGAKIWIENKVDFANPIKPGPVAAGVVIGIGGVAIKFNDDFTHRGHRAGHHRHLVIYHALHALAPAHMRDPKAPADVELEGGTALSLGNVEEHRHAEQSLTGSTAAAPPHKTPPSS